MTEKELKRLNRGELLEILLTQAEEIEKLNNRINELEKEVRDRSIQISNAGSIAEAALQLNGVFAAAESAAGHYLENVKETEGICAKMIEDAEKKVSEIEGRYQAAEERAAKAEQNADRLEAEAKARADRQYEDITARLEAFYEKHAGLKELLTFTGTKIE